MIATVFNLPLWRRLLRSFFMFFILYGLIDYLIPSKDEPYFSLQNFTKIIVFAAFMSVIILNANSKTGDWEGATPLLPNAVPGRRTNLLEACYAAVIFFILTIVAFSIAVAVFVANGTSFNEAGKNITRILVFTPLAFLGYLLMAWLRSRKLNRK